MSQAEGLIPPIKDDAQSIRHSYRRIAQSPDGQRMIRHWYHSFLARRQSAQLDCNERAFLDGQRQAILTLLALMEEEENHGPLI